MNGFKQIEMKLKKWICLKDCYLLDEDVILFKKRKTYKQVHKGWAGSVDEQGDNRGFGKLEKYFQELPE